MENASKALIIAGAILISILIIAIGMYIYTSSTGSIESAISSMDTQEIQGFNAQWSNYEGTKSGSQVKGLISTLIAHSNTYEEEPEKVIAVYCEPTDENNDRVHVSFNVEAGEFDAVDGGIDDTVQNELTDYISELNDLYTSIQAKHNYEVTLDYNNTALIRRIIIEY